MEVLQQILGATPTIDKKYSGDSFEGHSITFTVPSFHPRSKDIKQYQLVASRIDTLSHLDIFKNANKAVLIDKAMRKSPSSCHF